MKQNKMTREELNLRLPKPTPETEKRIIEVMRKLAKGQSRAKVTAWLRKEYDLSEKQAYDYVHDAVKYIKASQTMAGIEADDIRALQIERIENMLEEALGDKDRKSALKAQDMLNKIYQLYVEKQEVTVTNDVIKFNFGTND